MSTTAKILSLSYDSAVATKTVALKTYWRSVRLISDGTVTNAGTDSKYTNILLNGKCIDPETRNLYVFYIDTFYQASWIIEINIDTRVQTVVYYDKDNNIGFDPLYKIYNARVVHGRLIWTDNKNPIYQMDIERAKKSFYYKIGYGQYPVTEEWSSIVNYSIDQIVSNGNNFYKSLIHNNLNYEPKSDDGTNWKKLCIIEDAYYSMNVRNFYFEPIPPSYAPVVTYKSDDARKINNLRQTLFQVAYRYVYIDWRKSTFSPASVVPLPEAEEETATGLANEQISLNNKLKIVVNTGGEEVRAIEVIGRSSQDPSKWFLIDTIEKFSTQERVFEVSKNTDAPYVAIGLSVMTTTFRNLNAPPAPVAVAAINVYATSFFAKWNASTGAIGYYIDVSTNAGFTTYVSGYHNKNVGNVTLCVVNGIHSNVTYYYRVRAYDINSLISLNSNTISVVIVLSPPEAITASGVFATGLTANWNAADGATGYRLDVATDIGFTSFVATYSNRDVGNVLTWAITGLVVGTAYFYRLRAYNAFGTSANSNIISTSTDTPPSTPVATAATEVTVSSFRANWNVSAGAISYYLDVATDNAFVNFITGYHSRYVGNVLSSLITGLPSNSNYYYRVQAINSNGTISAYSNVITVLTLLSPPLALAASSIFGTGFTANWGAITGATGYYLDVSTVSTFASFVAGYNNKNVGNVITSPVTGLTLSTVYYYRVRAYTGAQTSASSNTISQQTLTPPLEPDASGATNITTSSFTANWGTSIGAVGFYFDVSTDSAFATFLYGYHNRDMGSALICSVTGLNSSTQYYYRVRAYDIHGLTSGYSNIIPVKTLLAPPVAIAASGILDTSFVANWNIVTGATKYYLDVATDSGFAIFVTGYNNLDVGSVTTYSVINLSKNTLYYYRVRAYNSDGLSADSNVISQRTAAPPSTFLAIAATNILPTGFTANWGTSVGASGYYLDVATDSGFVNYVSGYQRRDVGNVNTFLVRGLSSYTNYYYRLEAYDANGLLSGYSNTITTTTLPPIVPDIPVAIAATNVLSTSFYANWNHADAATGYKLDVATDSGFTTFAYGYNNREVGNVLTFNVTGLTAGTIYYYRVRAYNTGGTSSVSNSISVTTAITLPTITLSSSSWDFGGATQKTITVTITNATSWGVVTPSVLDYIHVYHYDFDLNTVILYYTGLIHTSDTVQFYVTGPGGTVYTTFTGSWT